MLYHHHDDVLVMPDDLIAFAWSAPMRDLAEKVGMSDVGLRKLLRGAGVVLPVQGHWNRVHAGRRVPLPPKAQPRGPGETGRIRLPSRFADVVPSAPPLSPEGPFASAKVPDDLEELLGAEMKAIGRVAVPRNLERPHPGLSRLLKGEERRRAKKRAPGRGRSRSTTARPTSAGYGSSMPCSTRSHGADTAARSTNGIASCTPA